MTPPLPLVEAISQRLASFASDRRREAEEFGDEALLMIDQATSALDGGKRLRGRFCATGWRAVSGAGNGFDPAAAIVGVAAALEVFQGAALTHDDVIDNSDVRRGKPAAHRALEAAHRAAGWTGDAASFGRNGAVLVGDLLVAWSDDLLEEALTGLSTAPATRAEYAVMRREVTVGQFLDVAEESAWRTAEESPAARALRIASLKSARYSVVQPLVIGGALAGGDLDQLDALRRFGHPLGLAFQLRDDVLGVFGDAERTGKPAGDDLREGKRTLLVAIARETLSQAERDAFDELLGHPDLDDAQIAQLRDRIVDSGALADVEAQIASLSAQARDVLSGARLDAVAVDELRRLAEAATVRTA